MYLLAASAELLLGLAAAAEGTGNHPEWPRWCGKAYQPHLPSFDLGGQTVEPPALTAGPGLAVRFKPRYSLYIEGETRAEFVVDAALSRWHGQPWPGREKAPDFRFQIRLASGGGVFVAGEMRVGSSGVFAFSLAGLRPNFDPYAVHLAAMAGPGAPNVAAVSELVLLPDKKTGSVTRLDNLNGGLLFRSPATGGRFEPFLPYGFYASCDGFLCGGDRLAKIRAYRDLGLNSMVSLTTVFDSRPAYELLDALDLRFMYDLRGYYKNLTAVRQHVSAIKDFDALYSWGSDEPDGH